MAAKVTLGCDPVVGSLAPSKKREYRVTNRLQEGKRPLYAVVFNFIDARFFNVFATVGGNRIRHTWMEKKVYGGLNQDLLECFGNECELWPKIYRTTLYMILHSISVVQNVSVDRSIQSMAIGQYDLSDSSLPLTNENARNNS